MIERATERYLPCFWKKRIDPHFPSETRRRLFLWIAAVTFVYGNFRAFDDERQAKENAINNTARLPTETSPLTREQRQRLGEALDNVSQNRRFEVPVLFANEGEAPIFAERLMSVFRASHWNVKPIPEFMVASDNKGIAMVFAGEVVTDNKPKPTNAQKLMDLLSLARIQFKQKGWKEAPSNEFFALLVGIPPD